MSTQSVRDYLTKQLSIEKNVVTYRSLSRALALNINVAKNELANFHAIDGQNVAATYVLSGQTQPLRKRYDEDIEMDDLNLYAEEEEEGEGEDGEFTPQVEITLVGQRDLESVQAKFTRLDSMHVYSLSPVAIRDAGLLCTPTEIVRDLDNKKGSELAATVGKVVGADMSSKPLPSWGGRKAPPPVAGSSKVTAGASTVKKDSKKEEEAKQKEKEKEKEKPKLKATGKLDFSKAKTKPIKKEEEKATIPAKAEPKRKVTSRPPSVASTISEKVQVKMEERKRGTKRKSALASDSEDEEVVVAKPAKPAAKPQQAVRVHRGAILSDDEDDEDDGSRAPSRKTKGKEKARALVDSDADSEAEKNLRAMMDIDDDAVTRASRDMPAEPEAKDEEMEAQQDVDVDMSDGHSKPKPVVKRKPKKIIPVGKNGLKKKRVVKSKTRIDEKGYMVTDDYSEYESVEEEEPPPPPKGKSKAKSSSKTDEADAAASAKSKPAAKPAPAKSAPTRSVKSSKSGGGSSKPAQQAGLASFFGQKSKSK
ncbi:DNA polymerase subunit Cdc27 [Mycena sp. CBHHK59/15]|nr:DNA polymerase subunit Cdc27 [Mycena sp. CBHHK59/15]